MSDFREIRFWGEDDNIKGGECLSSTNVSTRVYLIQESDDVYASLLAALTPGATQLGVTPAEFFEAIKLLDPVPEE